MTPELEYLLARCGIPYQVEEYVNDILSMAPSELTRRLMGLLQEAQRSSKLFPHLKRDTWYIVAPATPSDPPRCLLGETFIKAVITFPDLESPPASCSKKEREEFEKLYARTFLGKLQLTHNYAFALARAHEMSEVSGDLLMHSRDFLELSIYHAEREYASIGPADKRAELLRCINQMKDCLSAVLYELTRRSEEKGSP